MRAGGGVAVEEFLLTLWTADPVLAAVADRAGVDRVGVDLELRGKRARQEGLGTWISDHRADDLPPIGRSLTRSRLFARVNPLCAESPGEVERLVALGVQVLMLPMFRSAEELEEFAHIVDGRATIVPLLETLDAAQDIERVTRLAPIHELHIGINDLALSCGMASRFEVLDCEITDRVSAHVLQAGWRLGIGGIGRVGDDTLPLAPDLVYSQYARLGSSAALISRAFFQSPGEGEGLGGAVARSRERMTHWRRASGAEMREARAAFRDALAGGPQW